MSQRVVAHIDMDAFYASVEARRNDWEGESVVVCVYSGRSKDSGAVSTCSYEARELGIHAAMPIVQAKRIAEKTSETVHFVAMDKDYYRQVSEDIREILEEYSEKIEQASIDEYYLELDENFSEAEKIMKDLKNKVKQEFELTCSIGLSINKLVAKIASDQEKPEGLTIVKLENVEEFLQNLELEDLHGIGDKTVQKLESLGITSVKQLSETEPALLVQEFGEKQGLKLHRIANGKDSSKVKESLQKQVTKIVTLEENTVRQEKILQVFPELAENIVKRVKNMEVGFTRVALIIIDTELQMYTRSNSLKSPVQDQEIIVEKGRELLEKFMKDFEGEVRRVGLRVADFEELKGQTSFTDF